MESRTKRSRLVRIALVRLTRKQFFGNCVRSNMHFKLYCLTWITIDVFCVEWTPYLSLFLARSLSSTGETIIVILFDFNRSVWFTSFSVSFNASVGGGVVAVFSFAFASTVFASFACVYRVPCAMYLVAFFLAPISLVRLLLSNFHTVS